MKRNLELELLPLAWVVDLVAVFVVAVVEAVVLTPSVGYD
jgi:hypothetical protein